MSSKANLKIGISIGDLNGIGIEVILKTLSDNRIYQYCTPIIYGSSKALSYHRKAMEMSRFQYSVIDDPSRADERTTSIINCWEEEVNISFGTIDKLTGEYAIKALDHACNDLVDGKIDGLVTAPVNKHSIMMTMPEFKGQTEYLGAKVSQGEPVMIMVSDDLKVGLATGHIPLSEVTAHLSAELIATKIRLLNKSLKKDFLVDKPKIAVLGLNPHAGEKGMLGDEEQALIVPAIEQMRNENILALGPYPADGFFGAGSQVHFDGVLAMYHDQGLIPFKSLTFEAGVNFTAGLPVVRTSPDHGTAYDIAGKGCASHSSFREALFLCVDVCNARSDYANMHRSPLRKRTQMQESE